MPTPTQTYSNRQIWDITLPIFLSLLAQNVVTDEYYSVRPDGSYWLEPLGRRVLIQSLNDYMDETVTIKGVTRSRHTSMKLYVQSLAQKFKSFDL